MSSRRKSLRKSSSKVLAKDKDEAEDIEEEQETKKRGKDEEEEDGEKVTKGSSKKKQDVGSGSFSGKLPNVNNNTAMTLYQMFVDAGIGAEDAARYEKTFAENDITADMLPDLTYDLMKQLSVKVGHQMKIMKLGSGFTGTPVQRSSNGSSKHKLEDEPEEDGSMDITPSMQLPIVDDKPAKKGKKGKQGASKKVDVQEIRRNIRAAFVKAKFQPKPAQGFGFGQAAAATTAEKYTIEFDKIRDEIKKGRDFMISQADTTSALSQFEAVTDEFVTIGTELGENNIDQYGALLGEIAKAWVDILLSRNCKLDKVLRGVWENKLLTWEKSPDPEHGTFTDARWACKHGWHDTLLNNVLQGDSIGKFYEPNGLLVARLNMLEQEDDNPSALNLAQAVDMHNFAAKFLIKIGKVKEAETTALKLKDPAAAFSIAQIARPLDPDVAFNIAMHSITVSETWNTETMERGTYLCELAISQKNQDDLVKQCSRRIKNKTIQFELCKTLQRLEQLPSALEFGKIILKPYTADEIQKLKDERIKEKGFDPKVTDPALLKPINDEVDAITRVPRLLSKWLWDLAYDMTLATLLTKDQLNETLRLILDTVTEVEQLIDISKDMNTKAEYSQILKVGDKCLELLNQQAKSANEKKTEFLTRQHQLKLLRAEQDALIAKKKQLSKQKQKELLDLESLQILNAVNPYYDTTFDDSKLKVCRFMVQAALDSRLSLVPEKVMPKAKIDEVITSTLNAVEDVNHIIQLAEDMRGRGEFEYILMYGQRAQENIKKLFGEWKKREAKKNQLAGLRKEQAELQAKREQLDSEKMDKLHALELEELLFQLVPHYANQILSTSDNLNLSAARLMIIASLDIKARKVLELIQNPGTVTEAELEEDLWKVVDQCLKYVKNPAHMMQLGGVLKERDAFQIVLRLGKRTMDRIQELRSNYAERQKPIQKLALLKEEETRLIGLNKSLQPEQAEAIKKLEEEVKKMPVVASYDPQSSDEYDRLQLQVAQQMLGSMYDSKQKQEAKIAKDLELTEKQITKERESKTKEFEEVAQYCLGTEAVQSPVHMHTLASQCHGWKEYFLIIQIGNAQLQRIKELKKAQGSRTPFNQELAELRQEREKQAQHRKLLPAAQFARLEEMEFDEKLYRLQPSYLFFSLDRFDNMVLDSAQLMMRGILDAKDNFEFKVENDTEGLISQQQREKERSAIQKYIDNLLPVCMEYVVNPDHLFKIAKAVSDRPRKEVQIVFQFGEQGQAKIKEINELRKVRAPIQNQINALKSEIQALEMSKKPVPAEKQQELETLEKKIAKLPPYPHFSDLFNYHEYDQLNLKIVQVLIVVVLDYKNQIDENLKINVENLDKIAQLTAQREKVVKQIEDIVQLALTNVHDPQSLYNFQSDIRTRHEAQYVIQVGEKAINRIKELEAMREVRAPLEKQLDALKKEQEQLVQQKKKLSTEQEKQMQKLEEKIAKLPPWPHYANLHNYNQYNHLILQVHQAMVMVVLENKQTLENRVKQMKENNDPAYDEAKVEEERAVIAKQLKHTVTFALEHIQNPDNLSAIASDLQTKKEVDYVIEVAEKVQSLITSLEEKRKVRAPLQEQIDKLRKEEQQLAEKRKQLTPQQQQLLQQLEKQIASLPKWPYYASLFNYFQYNDLNLRDSQMMMNVTLEAKEALDRKVQQMIEDDSYAMNEDQINAERATIASQIKKVMEISMANLRNPQHLYNFASDAKNRREVDLVLESIKSFYHATKYIDELRAERAPIQKEIDKIRAEEEELVQQKKQLSSQQVKQLKQLEEKLKTLPDFPYYANLFQYNQYDRLNLQTAQLALDALFQKRTTLEEKFKQQLIDDPANANHANFNRERDAINAQIDEVVGLCLAHVHDPNLLYQFSNDLSNKQQSRLVLRVAQQTYERIDAVEKLREARDKIQEHIKLLQEEQAQLETQKKQLAPEVQKQLESLQEELAKARFPDYVSSAHQHDTLQAEVTTSVFYAVWTNKETLEAKIAANEDDHLLTDKEIQDMKDAIKADVNLAVKIFTTNVYNPNTLLSIVRLLREKREYDLVITVGRRAQDVLDSLEKARELREVPLKQLNKLREEKDLLEQNRKHLSPQQQEELRKLELEQRLLFLMPSYVSCEPSVYDDLEHDIAHEMIGTLIDRKVEYEDKIAMDDEGKSAEEIEKERKAMKKGLDEVVAVSVGRLRYVTNFIRLTQEMDSRKEFNLVITVGQAGEKRIEQLRQELEERELLQLKQKELEDKVILQKDGPTEEQKKILDGIKEALEKLPVIFDDKFTLDNYTLQLTTPVTASAKIEDNNEVLREQTTLAFKVQTTPERWNQVKMLTTEQEWDEVKKELVTYLLKASTEPEDKNFIDPTVKMDLLLAEGLWKESLEIYPKPTGNEEELENLYKLWVEVEKNSPQDLKTLLPIIQRYVKRYYQEFKVQPLDKIIDQVQRRFPDEAIELFEKGSEMMMLNIMPSQYTPFISYLRSWHKRVVGALDKKREWERWLTAFKAAHKGKKKLMNMVSMLSDSAWNIAPK